MATPRILVLDDDRSACHAVVRILREFGYAAEANFNPSLALQSVREQRVDLVVLDFQMPDMNGVEFLQLARARQADLQCIFVTAYTSLDTVYPAIQAGAERVLAKPPDAQELIDLVQRMVGPPRPG